MTLNRTTTTTTATKFPLPLFDIFPRHSVNLLTGPTSIGKTFFVTHIINHYKTYFASSTVKRVFIVLCNERVEPVELSSDLDVPIEQVPLSEFQVEHLEEDDLVLLDDVQQLTDTIRLVISVCTHHYNLASLFVVTHSLLGSHNFELLNLCHRVFLFLRAASNTRLTKYIIDNFYAEKDIKDYLKIVVEFCAREKNILALELNPVAAHKNQHFLAFSHLTHWTKKQNNYFFLYPMPVYGKEYASNFKHSVTFFKGTEEADNDATSASNVQDTFDISQLPPNTCVAVPAHVITIPDNNTLHKGEDCADKTQWEKTLAEIEDNIEDFFPSHKWRHCKNIVKEILKNPNICVTVNGRFFHLHDRPQTKINLISFVSLVTRRAAPTEKAKTKEWSLYMQHVDNLLRHDTPIELITNKLLLPKRMVK